MAVRKILSTVGFAGLSLAMFAATGMAVTTSSESMVRDGFSVALNAAPPTQTTVARRVPIAGTEDFWLTAVRPEGALPVTKAVAVGDRIGLSFGGKDFQLEVADVTDFAPRMTEIDTRSAQTRVVLVTARDASNANAHPIRFVMEVEQTPAGTVTAQAARTL